MSKRKNFIESENDAYVRAVHDRGLAFDLSTMSRRNMLAAVGSVGALALLGRQALAGDPAAAAACLEEVESETAGPYPADGSNGIEVRTLPGIVRSDIRSSFGASSTVADGIGLTIAFTLQDLACEPLVGAAIYVWHCDRPGNYSLYSAPVVNENYLRGIGVTDDTGSVAFTSIFPGCYAGRWPHIHFEVYASLEEATSGAGPIRKTSQIALPESTSEEVYATAGYEQSVTNLSRVTLASDNVFGDDNAARELAAVTGDVTSGYTATLVATVDPTAVETGGGGPGSPGGPGGPGGTPPTGPPPTSTPTTT